MRQFWRLFLDVFYPVRCQRCGQVLQKEALLCSRCHEQLTDRRFLRPQSFNCVDMDGICLLFRYEEQIRDVLHKIKFQGAKRYLPLLAEELLRECYCSDFEDYWDLPEQLFWMAIPTDARRRQERGYDVPTKIFEPWAHREELVRLDVLERILSTKPQFGLDRTARRKNVQGCFRARGRLHGETVFLVDDIFTTGATMQEAARTLKKSGAGAVYGIAFGGGAFV